MGNLVERVTSGVFVSGVLYYTTRAGKLYYSLLGKSFFYGNAEKKQFILGALPQQQRLYLFDRNRELYSHLVPFELMSQVRQFISGERNEPQVAEPFRNRIAKCYHAFTLRK